MFVTKILLREFFYDFSKHLIAEFYGLRGPALAAMDFATTASSKFFPNIGSEPESADFVEDLVTATCPGRGR